MSDLPAVVFKSDLARPAPAACVSTLLIQREGLELLIRMRHKQLSMGFLVRLKPSQVAQPVVIIGNGQLVVQISPVADDDRPLDGPAVTSQEAT